LYKKLIGILLIIIALIFVSAETQYFGNNLFPKTLKELICDLVSLFLLSLGFFLIECINKGIFKK